MKRTFLFLALAFAVTGAFAQKGLVSTAQSLKESGKLDKALAAINEAIDPANPKAEKTVNWPRSYEVKGEIYQAMYSSKDENMKKLDPNPLAQAFDAYMKALELDKDNNYSKSVKIKIQLLTNDLTQQAVGAFEKEDFSKALDSFERILSINKMKLFQDKDKATQTVDTVIIYNAGLAALNGKNYPKATQYLKEAVDLGYQGVNTTRLLAKAFLDSGDTISHEKVIKEGYAKHPESLEMLYDVINFYILVKKDNNQALKFIDLALEKDPKNATLLFAKGTVQEKTNAEDAAKSYQQAIDVKPDYFDAYYNLGALYYNNGVKFLESSNKIPTDQPKKYEEELKKADVEFHKSLPYMEKANELKAKDRAILESLKTLYYRLKIMDKFKIVEEELKNL
ncbi:MAG: tetratricopeptide repeat protein [Bacteroidota bacterium]|nr:tetratricopeptide repeat protein [Bacteroidota bacterium]MDP4204781.1 tetratricopeptide repeat protein [Bacteroidota bacterium]